MSVEKIAAIKAKRLAKKRTTIKVDDDLEAGVLVWKRVMGEGVCAYLHVYKTMYMRMHVGMHICSWMQGQGTSKFCRQYYCLL